MNTILLILLTFPVMIFGFETARVSGLDWLYDPQRRGQAIQNWLLLSGGGIAGGGIAGSFGEDWGVRIVAFIAGAGIIAASRYVSRSGSND